MADNDRHILQKLKRSRLTKIFVGIHGDPDDINNQKLIDKALQLDGQGRHGNLEVGFFDSSSAKVWG